VAKLYGDLLSEIGDLSLKIRSTLAVKHKTAKNYRSG